MVKQRILKKMMHERAGRSVFCSIVGILLASCLIDDDVMILSKRTKRCVSVLAGYRRRHKGTDVSMQWATRCKYSIIFLLTEEETRI